jgi:hypothetical protein
VVEQSDFMHVITLMLVQNTRQSLMGTFLASSMALENGPPNLSIYFWFGIQTIGTYFNIHFLIPLHSKSHQSNGPHSNSMSLEFGILILKNISYQLSIQFISINYIFKQHQRNKLR